MGMFRSLGLLVVLAGVAGYFTKPTEAQHREAANATLQQLQDAAASNLDLGGMLQTGIAQISQDGTYTDYYVASKYVVTVNERALAECWGAFGQVRCMPKVGAGEGQPAGGA
jgi:hypothetical protein